MVDLRSGQYLLGELAGTFTNPEHSAYFPYAGERAAKVAQSVKCSCAVHILVLCASFADSGL